MTIIAYRDGVLAADGLVAALKGDAIVYSKKCEKIMKTDYGLFGFSGDTKETYAWEKWAKNVNLDKLPNADIGGLWVDLDGDVWYLEKGAMFHVPDDYIACGNAMNIAMGAFYMGASAREAVEACIELSPACGGEIMELTLD